MEIENLVNDLIDLTGSSNVRHKNRPMSHKFINVFRRIRKGWLICLLIIAASVFVAWLLYFPLSKIHSTTTIMGVMFNKEKDANSSGNVANEIVSNITGWTTTTNKYDEMAVLTSHTIVGNMLRQTGKLDTVYNAHIQEIGHRLSSDDSIKFINAYVESFLKRVEATNTQTNIRTNIKTSLITLSMDGTTDECGPLLIGLVKCYNQYTRAYNNKLYDNTLHFLDHCIDSLRLELEKLDDYDRTFRENNMIVNFDQQTNELLSVDRNIEDDLRNMNLQLELLSIIRNYMIDMGNDYKVVPANTGIDDSQINQIVIKFNDLVMRRSNFLTSMGEDAMRVQTITNQIEDQREALIISIDKLSQSFNIRKAKFENDLKVSSARLEKMPNKRITLDQIKREREIKNPLYKLFQEKYTETLIAKSAEQDQARIVTYPYMEEIKLFENPNKLYIVGLLFGIIFSSIYLWFLKLPPHRMSLQETLQECDLPCWSVLPQKENTELYENALEAIFTRLRMSGAKTIAITCSYAYEEKSDLSVNLAKLIEQQGEKCQLVHYVSEEKEKFTNMIEKFDKSNGYLIIDAGSYHTNPEMPLVSQRVDITLWNVTLKISKFKSVDFINYAIKEKIVKNGALVLTDAQIDKNNKISYGTFDYNAPSWIASLSASIKS